MILFSRYTFRYFPFLFAVFFLFVFAKPQTVFQDNKGYTYYELDTARSKILWTNYHYGFVKFKSGHIVIDANNKVIQAEYTADMRSIADLDIKNKLLNGTLVNVLKSADFFNVSTYPEVHFRLNEVIKESERYYNINGDIIIFGDAICHNISGKIRFKNDSLYLDTKPFYIDRTLWGMYYLSEHNPYPKKEEENYVVSDSIQLTGHLVAYKKMP